MPVTASGVMLAERTSPMPPGMNGVPPAKSIPASGAP